MLYGCEEWAPKADGISRIECSEMGMMTYTCEVSLKEGKSRAALRVQLEIDPIDRLSIGVD